MLSRTSMHPEVYNYCRASRSLTVMLVGLWAAVDVGPAAQSRARPAVPSEKLGELEGPRRAEWQQPEQSHETPDCRRIPCGRHRRRRWLVHVRWPAGRPERACLREDIQRKMIESIWSGDARGAQQRGAEPRDAARPTPAPGLDAVLIVDTYPNWMIGWTDDPRLCAFWEARILASARISLGFFSLYLLNAAIASAYLPCCFKDSPIQ